jgi:hypothetical protein
MQVILPGNIRVSAQLKGIKPDLLGILQESVNNCHLLVRDGARKF